jgi:hypothetical protein
VSGKKVIPFTTLQERVKGGTVKPPRPGRKSYLYTRAETGNYRSCKEVG